MDAVYAAILPLVTLAQDSVDAKDVKAGWLAFGIFLLLVLATVFLCFNFVKQMRKAQAAKDAGAFGDEPVDRSLETSDPDEASPEPSPQARPHGPADE